MLSMLLHTFKIGVDLGKNSVFMMNCLGYLCSAENAQKMHSPKISDLFCYPNILKLSQLICPLQETYIYIFTYLYFLCIPIKYQPSGAGASKPEPHSDISNKVKQ